MSATSGPVRSGFCAAATPPQRRFKWGSSTRSCLRNNSMPRSRRGAARSWRCRRPRSRSPSARSTPTATTSAASARSASRRWRSTTTAMSRKRARPLSSKSAAPVSANPSNAVNAGMLGASGRVKKERVPRVRRMATQLPKSVVPAKAGTHCSAARVLGRWIPAFAGMTVLLVLLLAALFSKAEAAERASDRQILHVLDRLAFGPTAADVRHIKAIGIDRYIAEQLEPESIPEPSGLTERLSGLETLKLDPVQLFAEYGPLRATDGATPTPEDQKARRQRSRLILEQAQ